MSDKTLIVVSTEVLPEVFTKVLEVKRLIACGEEKSSASACKKIGISRSAYYKYRDCVYAYNEKQTQKVATFYIVLRDRTGVLSNLLSEIYKTNANVLTVNQTIPIDGVASVTITVRFNDNDAQPKDLESKLMKLDGVVEVKFLFGE